MMTLFGAVLIYSVTFVGGVFIGKFTENSWKESLVVGILTSLISGTLLFLAVLIIEVLDV